MFQVTFDSTINSSGAVLGFPITILVKATCAVDAIKIALDDTRYQCFPQEGDRFLTVSCQRIEGQLING